MKPLFNAAQVRLIEAECLASVAPGELIRRGGLALAHHAEFMSWSMPAPVRIHALCGPGNNGADARLAAEALAARGFATQCWTLAELQAAGASAEGLGAFLAKLDDRCLLIDGLFGIGLSRPIEGSLCTLIQALNANPCRILAVDIPSGLDASTGQVLGTALRANQCLSMLVDKTGLHSGEAAAFAPVVHIDELGCETLLQGRDSALQTILAAGEAIGLLSAADLPALLPRRSAISHKGTQGSVLVIGGDSSMKGAALLAAQGAQACGSGKVFVHFLESEDSALDSMAMQHPGLLGFKRPVDWSAALDSFNAVLIGCGLGKSKAALAVLGDVLKACKAARKPLVLDADALNLIAGSAHLQSLIGHPVTPDAQATSLPWVMTPHPLEAARLLGLSTAQVQADRYASARELCLRFGVCVILKGPGSVIAGPVPVPNAGTSVRLAVAPPGSPALAVAGSGDTLAGMVLSLLGQGQTSYQTAFEKAFDAASLAASVHALAAWRWSKTHPRAQGMRAEDLPSLIVDWMNFEH